MRHVCVDDLTHLTSEFELTRFKEDDLSLSRPPTYALSNNNLILKNYK